MPVFFKDVKTDMKKVPRDPNSYPRLPNRKVESIARPGIKSLTYKSIILGETDNYISTIQFFKVGFNGGKNKKFSIPSKVEGKLVYHEKLSIKKHPSMMKCSCPDFRFMWEKPLYDNKGLIGRFRKYTKVAGSTRPSRNPDERIGFCKHVNSLLSALKDSGQITD